MFFNEVKQIKPVDWDGKPAPKNHYTFDKPSPYLYVWSRLFQSVVSQAGTFLLTGKFHNRQCAIYKCEGGCNINGVGDLVLYDKSCHFDYMRHKTCEEEKMAKLISHIVLNWNPNEPIKSMITVASEFVKCEPNDMCVVLETSKGGGVFGGDSLSSFFNYNPFSPPETDREYERYCLVKENGKSNDEVDKLFFDRDLGKSLLKKIQDKCRSNKHNNYTYPLCCSPHRNDKGELLFWINTGRFTQIDGWKTEEQINEFLKSDGLLVDNKRI